MEGAISSSNDRLRAKVNRMIEEHGLDYTFGFLVGVAALGETAAQRQALGMPLEAMILAAAEFVEELEYVRKLREAPKA